MLFVDMSLQFNVLFFCSCCVNQRHLSTMWRIKSIELQCQEHRNTEVSPDDLMVLQVYGLWPYFFINYLNFQRNPVFFRLAWLMALNTTTPTLSAALYDHSSNIDPESVSDLI